MQPLPACLTLHIREPAATEGAANLFVDNLLLGQSFIHSRAALQQSIERQPSTQEFEKERKKH